jgi:lipoate-protein ligase A
VGALRLITDSFPDEPALDAAAARALLERVAAGELPETVRLARTGRAVAFGRRDEVSPGYQAAVRAAADAGFEHFVRLGGGRAAVFHEGTLVTGHAIPDPDPRPGIQARFEREAALITGALRGLGVDARVGEIPGEYCPGGFSVNARGTVKLAGLGQRLVAGAAHVGAVIVVDGADLVREVLDPIYTALELDWDPATVGAVGEEAPGATVDDVFRSLRAAYEKT